MEVCDHYYLFKYALLLFSFFLLNLLLCADGIFYGAPQSLKAFFTILSFL